MARIMIALARTALVLLCAGRSERFGDADKLLHELQGKPLVLHATDTLTALRFKHKIATVRPDAPGLHSALQNAGFTLCTTAAEASQAESLQCGLEAALLLQPDAILLALGDMPYVTAEHVRALAQAAKVDQPALSCAPDWTGPPWIASTRWVLAHRSALKDALLRDAVRVLASPQTLRDIDRISDLD